MLKMKEIFRLPMHRQSNCYCKEDDRGITLVSYITDVAYFDKHSHRVKILDRYSATTDRHCRWFIEYLHQRYQKPYLKIRYDWIDRNFNILMKGEQ